MTDKVVILVTTGNVTLARKIARALVEARLAACVTISSPVESIYPWQGKIETGKERVLMIKTSRAAFAAVETEIHKHHDYATPEIICLPIVEASRDYLDWMDRSLAVVEAEEA